MSALAAGVQRTEIPDNKIRSAPQKDNTIVYQGGIVMLDTSGRATPAGTVVASDGHVVGGVALPRDGVLDRYDNTVVGHADGFLTVRYQEGRYAFDNDSGNPILSTTQPGTPVYAVDDHTVSLSSSTSTRPMVGRLVKLDTGLQGPQVVVDINLELNHAFSVSGG